ncbi:unnamed protein product [Meganyctiphanes norvegica]|uniref:Alcohol acetyltransferase n=1 Tax=Meganyctiphanes norvegica TaxID=48144 RepID=A0AAV2RNN9_MEGNR
MSCGGWVRVCTDAEEYHERCHQRGWNMTCYGLDLATAHPLTLPLLQKALEHLYRFRYYDCASKGMKGKLWFRELDTFSPDLEVLKGVKFKTAMLSLAHSKYNVEDGPLWRVRLLPFYEDEEKSMPEMQKDFPYYYHLIFAAHHSIVDGFTNVKICNLLHKLIDDLMSGIPINDSNQLGCIISENEIKRLLKRAKCELTENPELLHNVSEDILGSGKRVSQLMKAYPVEEDAVPNSNMILIEDLNKDITKLFIAACKNNSVSIHSALSTIFNCVVIQMLKSAGINDEFYNIRSSHDINYRRYSEDNSSCILGCHVGALRPNFLLSKDTEEHFWDVARNFHNDFHTKLESNYPFFETVLEDLKRDEIMDSSKFGHVLGLPWITFYITNMGNLATVLPGEGTNVQIVQFRRFGTVHKPNMIICNFVHTFRGRLSITTGYNTQRINKETAQKILDQVFVRVKQVSYHGGLV